MTYDVSLSQYNECIDFATCWSRCCKQLGHWMPDAGETVAALHSHDAELERLQNRFEALKCLGSFRWIVHSMQNNMFHLYVDPSTVSRKIQPCPNTLWICALFWWLMRCSWDLSAEVYRNTGKQSSCFRQIDSIERAPFAKRQSEIVNHVVYRAAAL